MQCKSVCASLTAVNQIFYFQYINLLGRINNNFVFFVFLTLNSIGFHLYIYYYERKKQRCPLECDMLPTVRHVVVSKILLKVDAHVA